MPEHVQEPARVFISYSHKDTDWLSRLLTHLKPLERHYGIKIWDDTKIRPGSKWREEIEGAIDSARAIILLISADFLASDFMATEELPAALSAAEQKGAVILPVVLSPCRLSLTKSLEQFQAFNDASNPLIGMTRSEQESVFVRISETVESLLVSLESQDAKTVNSASGNEVVATPSRLQDIGKYAIVGLDDESLFHVFMLFGDPCPPTDGNEASSLFEEIYFDDFAEMKEVFDELNHAVANAKELEKKGMDRQRAFERTLKEKIISRASRLVTQSGKQQTSGPKLVVPGFKYIILGVRRGYSDMIRVLRPQEFGHKQSSRSRDALEVYFSDVNVVPQIPLVIQSAVEESKGDDEEFKRLLFEAAMRLRAFGVDSED
jgi:hypothetical protein